MKILLTFSLLICFATHANIKAVKTKVDLSTALPNESVWKDVPKETINLMGQPLVSPKPKKTETSAVNVQAIHDGQWIAFRLNWKADKKNEAGKQGQFSDAVAIQFPVKEGAPPPIFMGGKGNPVHILHWRAQYQRDEEKGKPEMKDLYPNMNPDMYPMEFKDSGKIKGLNAEKREVYSPGKSSGNPQSYTKHAAVDEIIAEGFGSSSVIENKLSRGKGVYDDKQKTWTVVISRPLARKDGSVLKPGQDSYMAFAVWQGNKQEVGSRKSITMNWVPLKIEGVL